MQSALSVAQIQKKLKGSKGKPRAPQPPQSLFRMPTQFNVPPGPPPGYVSNKPNTKRKSIMQINNQNLLSTNQFVKSQKRAKNRIRAASKRKESNFTPRKSTSSAAKKPAAKKQRVKTRLNNISRTRGFSGLNTPPTTTTPGRLAAIMRNRQTKS